MKQICIANGVDQAYGLCRAISTFHNTLSPFIFALLPAIGKFICISFGYIIRHIYIRNLPQMCKRGTMPTNEREATSTWVGPTCRPGLSSV